MAEFVTKQRNSTLRVVELIDLPAIYRLYRSVEPEDHISEDAFARWWRWLYVDNPAGKGFALGAFDAQGNNLGHIALAPLKFAVDGEVKTAGFSAQLMVAEGQRHTLLYPTLIKGLLKTYAAFGCEFCYSEVTRQRVLAANTALGFRKGGVLGVYARPYRFDKVVHKKLGGLTWLAKPAIAIGNLLCRISLPASIGNISIRESAAFTPAIEPFLASMRHNFKLAAVRTVEILNWRFTGNKDRNYRILIAFSNANPVGYAVVRRMPMKSFDVLAIVDILFDLENAQVGRALLRQIHQMALADGVDLAAVMINREGPFVRLMRMSGFLSTPESFTVITHEPPGEPNELRDRPHSDWHLTWFDHDFV